MNRFVRQLLPFGTLILLIAALSALEPDAFLKAENFFNVLSRSSVNGIIAMGMTAVIISGGIDLSVGSMMAMCGMVAGLIMSKNGAIVPTPGLMWIGTAAGIGTGLVCGLLNGALITKLNLPPFIVTLGTMSAFRGISYVMNDGMMFDVPTYTFLGQASVAGVPVNVLVCLAIVLLAFFILRYMPLGRYTYAIGSNRQAAYHAGVNVNRSLLLIYTLTGVFIGLAAMIATSRTVSAQPTAGQSLELDVIAAVVIGGASLSGGRGTVVGTVIGTLLISFLRNGLTLLGISTNIQLVVIGAIIIGAVALDQMARAKAVESR
ncbi:MAG TPA: ABC transporter permease [Sedimentisphaerales bacterium]|jgi:ribose/xylose/arabinose/galactoside ABC-type transport system permease subunit|nr:ABC transporter permease [Sedimentisphaerales bacterium]HNU30773.1 ABC transporter permease [Sedimentisphaerales bacterium]